MRISDWSSDVCSSDLNQRVADDEGRRAGDADLLGQGVVAAQQRRDLRVLHLALQPLAVEADRIGHRQNLHLAEDAAAFPEGRSEESRVGKECVVTWKYGGSR